jgi:hypothetical protein
VTAGEPDARAGYERMIGGVARFRVVLVPGG